jgi:hypothetical protein
MKKIFVVLVTVLMVFAFPSSVFADCDVDAVSCDDGGDSSLNEDLVDLLDNVETTTPGTGIRDLSDDSSDTTVVLEIIAPNNVTESDPMYIIAPNNIQQGRTTVDADWNELSVFYEDFAEEAEIDAAPNNLLGFTMILAPNNIIFPNNVIAPSYQGTDGADVAR